VLKSPTRRNVLAGAAAAGAVARAAAATARPVRLGGPIFLKSDDPAELAREHRRLGYSAAYCPNVKPGDKDRIRAIRDAFAKENVVIAEVGAWKNMLDPDPATRKANYDFVAERLALAEEIGARCCVDIAGSYNPKIWYGPHPANLSAEFMAATVENCRKLIDAVKPKRTRLTIEVMGWAIPDGPDTYLELIKKVDRPAFGVHMDVCNGINSPRRYYANSKFITECFEKLGRWVVSCHAKDLDWVTELNVHFIEVIPGRGSVDYKELLRQVSRLPMDAPLMLEHLKSAAEYDEGRAYIQKIAAETGVTFA
jgi:sugar phosphate isomerase/epimerase